jgi:hypothetical protein
MNAIRSSGIPLLLLDPASFERRAATSPAVREWPFAPGVPLANRNGPDRDRDHHGGEPHERKGGHGADVVLGQLGGDELGLADRNALVVGFRRRAAPLLASISRARPGRDISVDQLCESLEVGRERSHELSTKFWP